MIKNINCYIYSRFANQIRTEVSQPLLGLGGKGIQDYASLYADESTIKTMLRNSNLIAENLMTADRGRLNYLFKKGDRFLESAGANRDWPAGRGIFMKYCLSFESSNTS